MLPSTQRLRENVSYLLIYRNILQLFNPSLNIIFDKVISNLYMLRPIMKYRILKELNATLIIILYNCGTRLHIKQIHHQLAKPQGLTTSLTGCHILVDEIVIDANMVLMSSMSPLC